MARTAIHPGEHLTEQIEDLDIQPAELAFRIGVSSEDLLALLEGKVALTGEMALRLGHFFETSPEFWMNLQKLYELRLAEKRAGDTIKTLPRLSDLGYSALRD